MYLYHSILLIIFYAVPLLLTSTLFDTNSTFTFNKRHQRNVVISPSHSSKRDFYSSLSSIVKSTIYPYPSIPFFPISPLFKLTANLVPIDVALPATYHVSTFSAKSGVLITIIITYTGNLNSIKQYTILPSGTDIKNVKTNGNQLTFSTFSPRKLEVRINGAVTKIGDTAASSVLYVIIDLPENINEIPKKGKAGVMYFEKGVHNLGFESFNHNKVGGRIAPKEIYLAPEALVNAAWEFIGTKGLTISGRGFLRNTFQDKSHNMIYFAACQNVVIKDVFIIDSPQHVIAISSGSVGKAISSQFLIDNVKSLHKGGNSDGFSYFGPTNNIVVQNTLLINMDNQIVLQAGLPSGPYDNTFINNIFVKPNSAGNFMFIQSPPKAFGQNSVVRGTIGRNNQLIDMDVLRLSGEMAFILFAGSNAVEEIIFDNLKVGTFHPRPTSSPKNYFLHLSSSDSRFDKSITFRNTHFPAFPIPFSGSVLKGNWKAKFIDSTVGGIPLKHDAQIGLSERNKGGEVWTSYKFDT